MIVPHHSIQPARMNISLFFLSLLVLILLSIGGLTLFIITRHVDYIQTKRVDEHLRRENEYFAREAIKVRGLADDLKEMQREVLSLLNLRPKKNVSRYKGKGGGSLENNPQKLFPLTMEGFKQNVALLKREVRGRKEDFTTIKTVPLIWPTEGRITSPYGYRINPFSKQREFHLGIDIANSTGTPIKAPADGVVSQTGWDRRFGHFLVIRHGEISTKFAHCKKFLVKRGDRVKRGQTIALMGNSGSSTGSHLHYEVRIKNRQVNPWRYLCLKIPEDWEEMKNDFSKISQKKKE